MHIRTLIFSVILCAFMAGCATPKPAGTPLEKPGDLSYEALHTKDRFRKYKSVGIVPFDNSQAEMLNTNSEERSETEALIEHANSYLIDGFEDEMADNFYESYGVVESDADYDKYDLVIEGKYLDFDRGNQASRYWLGTGFTHVAVSGRMVETATGKVVADFRDIKYGTGGAFGGDSIELMMDNLGELGGNLSDFLEEVY